MIMINPTFKPAFELFLCQKTKAMKTLTATDARARLYLLIDEAASSHEPILITGKRGNAVLLSEEDWRNISETLYLVSIPVMRESIIEGMKETLSDSSKDLDW